MQHTRVKLFSAWTNKSSVKLSQLSSLTVAIRFAHLAPSSGGLQQQQQHLLHHNRKTLLKNTLPSHYRRPEVQDLAQAYNSNRYAVVEVNDFG
jgi:hypothetical protein